jgi:hypothetical protein
VLVPDPEFSASPLYELRDSRIVDVAHAREEVMLDLEIQAAKEPARGPAVARKIDARLDLVNSPRRDHATRSEVRGKVGVLYTMRELEYDAKRDPHYDGYRDVGCRDRPGRV